MRCPSCGAIIKRRSMRCQECGAFRNESWLEGKEVKDLQASDVKELTSTDSLKNGQVKPSPSLIEFPGVSKTSVPQWRKELGERVREVQERRAREAALEAGMVASEVGENGFKTGPSLELLPPADPPQMNPLVVAALERIERAHSRPQFSARAALATVFDYDDQGDSRSGVSVDIESEVCKTILTPSSDLPPQPEKNHNLTVVPAPVIKNEESSKQLPKPKRLIGGTLDDPALNYLDSLPTTTGIDIEKHRSAPVCLRLPGAVVDLILVSILSAPVLVVVELAALSWQDPRVIAFVATTFLLVGFLYLTISTAFTGRTLGMRMFSLRVVDARTGLIPTGAQSAGRSFFYLLSLLSAGIALLYAFIDRERLTVHDRFTRTAVVRV